MRKRSRILIPSLHYTGYLDFRRFFFTIILKGHKWGVNRELQILNCNSLLKIKLGLRTKNYRATMISYYLNVQNGSDGSGAADTGGEAGGGNVLSGSGSGNGGLG